MKRLQPQEIKDIEFKILKHFKSFCEKNNIRFYLSNGTLLGAVKYKGFIPWDDDIDVFVPREDYDRLVMEYENSGDYKLFSGERNEGFLFPFAKLCDMSTVKEETDTDNGVTLGLDIDIFPLDVISGKWFPKMRSRILRLRAIACMLSKMKETGDKPFYKRIICNICRRIGTERLVKTMRKRAVKYRGETTPAYVGCAAWPIYGERELMTPDVFDGTVPVSFEGELFPAPSGYDTYLRSLYGDYEKDPPVDEQRTHHSFEAFRIIN